MIFVLSSLRYVAAYAKPFSTPVITLNAPPLPHFVCTVLCTLISVRFLFCFPSVMEVPIGTQSSIYLAVQAPSEV